MAVRAVTFDYWDTLYSHEQVLERLLVRRAAVHRMLLAVGHDISEDDFAAVYRAAHDEAERWWRDGRAYTTHQRIRWMLASLEVERPDDCEHVTRAIQAIDQALIDHPPPLFSGAADAVARLSSRYTLGIISDTGFGSGNAQNLVLQRDGLLNRFAATIYSMDVGHAKPRPEPFAAAVAALGVDAADIIHIGDNERTDIRGARAAGLRAVRVDIAREGGPTEAEFVARSHAELADYLLSLD